MKKKTKVTPKATEKAAKDHSRIIGHKGAQSDASPALKKYRDRMVDDEYEQRRNNQKPKKGPGFKEGGKVGTKTPPLPKRKPEPVTKKDGKAIESGNRINKMEAEADKKLKGYKCGGKVKAKKKK